MIGVVLAGGESRRAGFDKARALLGGEPAWRRQARILRSAGADPVVLVRRPGQPAPDGIACWRDSIAGAGPLAGLHAALARRQAAWIAVLAVDMPGIDSGWFRWLSGFCRQGVGAIGRHPAAFEPLAAIYPAEALAEVEVRLRRHESSLQGLALALAAAGRLRIVPLPAAQAARVASLNAAAEWSDWSRAQSGLP